MTRFLLVRHAAFTHAEGTLAGRTPSLHLSNRGRTELRGLVSMLSDVSLAAVVSSPLERTRETAAALAEAPGLDVEVSEAFHEVDFGAWTGCTLDELDGRPEWARWNRFRSTARVPGGESMADVLRRALAGVEDLADRYPDGAVAVVTHADVVRPLLVHFLGMPMDHLLRLEITTASVSTVELGPWGVRVLEVNRTGSPYGTGTP